MTSRDRRASVWRPAWGDLTLAGIVAVEVGLLLRVAIGKVYSSDEFTYAHAGWLIAQGFVPYRDFALLHPPFTSQIASLLFHLTDDNPANIVWLRVLLALSLSAACVLASLFANREDGRYGWLAGILMWSYLPFVYPAIEIRPDSIAYFLFLAALAPLSAAGAPGLRGCLSGLCLAGAFWASEKALLYGAPMLAASTIMAFLRAPESRLFGRAFLSSQLVCLGAIGAYLILSGSAEEAYSFIVSWAIEHERSFPPRPAISTLADAVAANWWIFPCAALGVARTAQGVIKRSGSQPLPDALLLAALPIGFLTFAAQRAAFQHSLIPFLGLVCIFAARGLAQLSKALPARVPAWLVMLGIAVSIHLHAYGGAATPLDFRSNVHQHALLEKIGSLSRPGEVVYDNSGRALTRPHLHFYFFTDTLMRKKLEATLTREIPDLVIQKECALAVLEPRFYSLSRALKRFFATHFVRYSESIALWGKRFDRLGTGKDDRFYAIRSGRYFVYPQSAGPGSVKISDRAPVDGIFSLEKGWHEVSSPDGEPFIIAWLPANGERYVPLDWKDPNR